MDVDLGSLDALLASFEAHSRDHKDDDRVAATDIPCSASSVDSGSTQKGGDCVDILTAGRGMILHLAGRVHEDPSASAQLSVKLCQLLHLLLEGRACPHSNLVFGFGNPVEVRLSLVRPARLVSACYIVFVRARGAACRCTPSFASLHRVMTSAMAVAAVGSPPPWSPRAYPAFSSSCSITT